jgi:ComF family protein
MLRERLWVTRGLSALSELLAPSFCVGCGLGGKSGLCESCLPRPSGAQERRLEGVRVFAATPYRGVVVQALHELKYRQRTELAVPLARGLLGPLLTGLGEIPGCVLVPVPSHPVRLAERGYNPAGLLATALGRQSALPVRHRLLRRTKAGEQQAGLGPLARQLNVKDAFAVANQAARTRVIVVDDVVTTGATLRACLLALAAARFEVLAALALAGAGASAHGLDRGQQPVGGHEVLVA